MIHTHHQRPGGRWIEATHRAADALYGWYHLEPGGLCPKRPGKAAITAPEIGALVSHDDGASWTDLGIILTAPGEPDCGTENEYFGGGEGDFSVLLDERGEYLYFLFTAYHREPAEQGVAVARMRYAERLQPIGAVWKWHAGDWSEPGLRGRVSPILAAERDWRRAGPNGVFWGPSVHWNSYLGSYVVLLNHATSERWTQDGVYLSFNTDLADPTSWSHPELLLEVAEAERDPPERHFYPRVLGLGAGETDKLAGQTARLFLRGQSRWEIRFLRPGEVLAPPR